MAGIGVAVALDRDEGRVGWQVDGWVKALSFIAEQAGRQDQVASLVKFVVVGVALAVLGRLQAEQLGRPRVVLPQLDRDARGRVAVASRVDHTEAVHLPVVSNRVHALAVGTVRAIARTRAAWGQVHIALGADGCLRVAGNGWVVVAAEGGRDVVFARIGLGLVVVARQVEVRGRGGVRSDVGGVGGGRAGGGVREDRLGDGFGGGGLLEVDEERADSIGWERARARHGGNG
mmetsp:Transcript_50783/g.110221  ORF Transcript_50783/g.110221 Transcript_50783/m.110221 type:complete len:232 (-) Transcript_50783:998-1693(-)